MKLPELSADAEPQFVDARSCVAWLELVPLANVSAAQREIAAQVEEFNRFPASAAHRLAVMEALREAVNFVQIEQAKRFTNRALPMGEADSAVFDATVALWEGMRLGYQRCLESAVNGDRRMRAQAALICQRSLAYSGLKMFHHYRAYRQVPSEDWGALNEAYAHAEKLDVADEGVKDFLNRDVHDTSPRIAYARAVLMDLANPNELSQRQLTFVAYLLERWASKLGVSEEPVEEDLDAPPLVADLDSSSAPERVDEGAGELRAPRYLDTRKLAKSLRNRVALLRKGESPAKLALGEDCVQPSCEQLLVYLYRQWCQAKAERAAGRRSAGVVAQACGTLGAMHHFISGQALPEAPVTKELTQQQRQELETLGRVRTQVAADPEPSDTRGYFLERWHVRDQSPQGMSLVRAAGGAGRRYTHGELMAVREEGASQFALAQIRWLLQAGNGDLQAGLRLMPGIPGGVGVRPTGMNAPAEDYTPALSLAAAPALEAPATLLLPPGWYKPRRVLELYAGETLRVRLAELLERGMDYERVTYEPVS